MGMGDSTLGGQSYFLNINKGFCNDQGPCTVLAGKVGVMFEDGTVADPARYGRDRRHERALVRRRH